MNKRTEVTNTVSNVLPSTTESDVVELFNIGANEEKGGTGSTKPFWHRVHLYRPQGEVTRVWANIDDGAMREVMSSETAWEPSSQLLRVANGVVIQSEAKWEGEIGVNGIRAKVAFEVFDSGGRWGFLFGKTLLETFKATHDYELDEITISGVGGKTTLSNQTLTKQPLLTFPICVVTEDLQHDDEEQPSKINVEAFQGNNKLFTRLTDPFKPERVEDLIQSFADVFTLSR